MNPMRACACGKCGLTHRPRSAGAIHKLCPNRAEGRVMPCACGCGKTYVKEKFSRRKYAEGCASAYQRWLDLKRAARNLDPSQRPKKPLRSKQHVCLVCFNIPDRREKAGCNGCGLPYGEDTTWVETPVQHFSAIALCER